MSPFKTLPTADEHQHQVALFSFLSVACLFGFEVARDERAYTIKGWAKSQPSAVAIPELKWVHAIPNGGSRGSTKREAQIVGGRMKAEGVKSGVSDLFVPIPRHGLFGLYIEMKRLDGGSGLSANQKEFGAFAQAQGYGFMQADGWIAAADAIQKWMAGPLTSISRPIAGLG